MSWAEAKWTVDTIVQKIGQPPNNMRAFRVNPSTSTSVALNFLEPEDSYANDNIICAVDGVMIRMSDDGYPASPSEGTLVVDNKELGKYENEPFIVEGLIEGRDYYFTAFPYSFNGVYNMYNNSANRATCTPGANVYGISRDITASSPEWARTDLSYGWSATASVGTVAGSSDFDNAMPWAGIEKVRLDTMDYMIKIPKFYFQRYREGNIEYIRIADMPKNGFKIHPLFVRGGVIKDYAYVGAYTTSVGNTSIPGAYVSYSKTMTSFRDGATKKGTGWSLFDINALSAIQMLMLVEFANNDVQTVIGRGYASVDNEDIKALGTCDNVPNLTGVPSGTTGTVDVVWRGIEGLWGNLAEFVDGVVRYNQRYYVCGDPAKYGEQTVANDYADLGVVTDSGRSGYITDMCLVEGYEHIMLPLTPVGGNGNTYYCDEVTTGSDDTLKTVLIHGGLYDETYSSGIFKCLFNRAESASEAWLGSRLLYIP